MTCPRCTKSHDQGRGNCEVCKVCMEDMHVVPEIALLELARSKELCDLTLAFENDSLRQKNLRIGESCDYMKKAYDSFVKAWQDGTLQPYTVGRTQ